MTLAEALVWARQAWAKVGEPGNLDAEVLLASACGRGRAYLYTWPEAPLSAEQEQRFRALVERRREGWPVAYLVGRQEFWSLELEVTPDVLIPRPETELLVEEALRRLPKAPAVLDLGTGSGAIALAIAQERPPARVVAVDLSRAALDLAQRNARRLGIENVDFRLGDWYQPIRADERFDLIASNPPYIGASEPEPQQGDCRFEPRQALIAAEAGLAALRQVFNGASRFLRPGGWVIVEHGYRQQAAVQELAHAMGLTEVSTLLDLQGHPRVTIGRRNP